MNRVLDISITRNASGYILYVPIKSGHLEINIEIGELPKLERFLETVLNSNLRRFGENPSKD